MQESYARELVGLIVRAVEAHNAHYAALAASGISIALAWRVRADGFVHLARSCACLSCAAAQREHDCSDQLRISATDAALIDGLHLTDEQRAIAYLVGVGCEHPGPASSHA